MAIILDCLHMVGILFSMKHMLYSVFHSKKLMREADANDTSGELGSVFPGSLVGESVFRTAKLEMLIESVSWLFWSARVNVEH